MMVAVQGRDATAASILRRRGWVLVTLCCLTAVACEKLPPREPPTQAERALVEQRVQAYFRRAVAVGAHVTMTVTDVEPGPLGLLTAHLELSNGTQAQKVPLVVSRDGRYLVQGSIVDLTVDPLQAAMEKISLSQVPLRGNPNAPVTIVEFSDLQCPFCARAHKDVEEQILSDYGDRVRLVFKHFPLSSHAWAEAAAIATLCAKRQSEPTFWTLSRYLFENQNDLTRDNLNEKAVAALKEEGVDLEVMRTCMEQRQTLSRVQADIEEAVAVGVRSTPTFFINGRKLEGALPMERFREAIDEAERHALRGRP